MPLMSAKDAGSWKAVTTLSVKDAGSWKTVISGKVRDAGSWKEFLSQPLSMNIENGPTMFKTCTSFGGSCTAIAGPATTITAGGTPPYTYLWEFLSGDSFTISTPTDEDTDIRKTNTVAGDPTFVGNYSVTVTDDDLDQVADAIEVTLTFIDLS